MIPLQWFKLEAEPPQLDDPYPSESWTFRVSIDPVLGGVSFHNSLKEALDYLVRNGYLSAAT